MFVSCHTYLLSQLHQLLKKVLGVWFFFFKFSKDRQSVIHLRYMQKCRLGTGRGGTLAIKKE